MVELENIDWDSINAKLPYKKTPQQKAQRRKLYDSFNINGNKYLSLAEVDKGLRDVLKLDEVFSTKPVIIRAFNAAKNIKKKKTKQQKLDKDYVERYEFRILLLYLRQYFEYYQAFCRVDTSDDRRIDLGEFIKAKPMMEIWVGPINDPEETFNEIDQNGGGKILFDEFCKWAIEKNLDLEDDVD